MPLTRIRAKVEIDAAHRVPFHASKCKSMHGHRYLIEGICEGDLVKDGSEQQDMVLDFAFLKESMMDVIDKYCDHGTILSVNDPQLPAIFDGPKQWQLNVVTDLKGIVKRNGYYSNTEIGEYGKPPKLIFPDTKLYLIESSPTAECLAHHWYDRMSAHIREEYRNMTLEMTRIIVWETPNFYAEYPIAKNQAAFVDSMRRR